MMTWTMTSIMIMTMKTMIDSFFLLFYLFQTKQKQTKTKTIFNQIK